MTTDATREAVDAAVLDMMQTKGCSPCKLAPCGCAMAIATAAIAAYEAAQAKAAAIRR